MNQLYKTLTNDRLAAMKAAKTDPQEKIKYTLLGVILGDVKNMQRCSTDIPLDKDVLKVLKKIRDSVVETLDIDRDFDKSQMITEEKILGDYLKKYTPQLLSQAEITTIVTSCFVKPVRIPDVQKYFKQNYEGQYDGAVINKVVLDFNS